MIKKYSSTLLLSGVALSLIGGSFLSAADRGQRRAPQTPQQRAQQQRQQATQPKQNPFQRYNDVAQKYYEAEPTADIAKEFKALLEKDTFFSIKKQCKIELELLLEDIEAKVEVRNLTKQAAQEFMQKPENRTIIAKIGVGNHQEIVEKAREKQKTAAEKKPKPPLTKREKFEQVFGTPGEGEEEIEEEEKAPELIPQEPEIVPGKGKGAPEAEAGVPNISEELVEQIVTAMMSAKPEPPLKAVGPLLSAPTPTKPKQEYLALAAAPTVDEKALAPAFAEGLAVVLGKRLEKIEATVKKEIITAIIVNNATLFTQFTPEERKATSGALKFMATADSATIQENIGSILGKLDTTLAPKDMSKILRNNGVMVAATQQQRYETLPSLIYSIGRDGKLENIENFAFLIKNTNAMLQNAIATIKLVAPTVTTGLLMAPDEKTTEELDIKFRYLLQAFDALLDSVDLRALSTDKPLTSLSTALSNYTNSYAITKLVTRSSKTTEGIVPQLISITAYLSTTGMWFITIIEEYVKQFGPVMNQEIMKSYNEGEESNKNGLLIPRYENQDTSKKHKYDYRDALIKKLQALEALLNKAINALSDEKQKEEYTKEVKRLGKQFKKNIGKKEALPGEKPKTPSRIKLPGTAKFTTGGRTAKPSGRSPIVAANLPQPTEKLKPVTPLPAIPLQKPKPTALLPATDTEFETLKREITTLNERTATSKQLIELRNRLSEFSERSEYDNVQKILDKKEEAISKRLGLEETTKSLNEIIEDIQAALKGKRIVPSNTIGSWVIRLNLGSRGSTDALKPLYTEIETKLREYAKFLLSIISDSASLQTSPATFLETGTSEQLTNIARSAAALPELTRFMPADAPGSVDKAVANLCATYDAILHALYTPAEFDPLLDRITVAKNQPRSTAYTNLIETAKRSVEPLIETLDALNGETQEKGLMTKDNGDKFRDGSLNITDIDQTLLANGAYKYEVAQGFPVTIDAATNLSIPTLSALDATHHKEYEGILTEWRERLQNNGAIESLRKFDPKTLSTLDSKKFATLMTQLEKLKETMPTLFETDPTLKELSEQVETINNNRGITDIIKALSDAIKLAQESFTAAKRITLVEFEVGYNKIQDVIKELPENQSAAFNDDIKKVVAQFSAYLTLIAQSLVVPSLPERGYDAQASLEAIIKNIAQNLTEFIAMLTQLKNSDLLTAVKEADNSFVTVYTAILQNYCYLLATFDALTANLFDGAHIQNPNFLQKSFAYITGAKIPTNYESAMDVIDKLLKPLEQTRSRYYQTLIEPFFVQETEIQSYLKGELNLATPALGLKDLVKNDNYIYAREKKPKSKIQPITGLHLRNKEYLSSDIVHGGDKQYGNIIETWENLIKKALPEEYKKQQLEQITAKLDSILDTPFGNPIEKPQINVALPLATTLGINPNIVAPPLALPLALSKSIELLETYLPKKYLPNLSKYIPDLSKYKPEETPEYRAYFNDMYSIERRSYSEENVTNVYAYLKDAFDPRISISGVTNPIVGGGASAAYEATEQVKQMRRANDIRSIAEFLITLKDKLSDPTILTELVALEKKGLLTDEIRTRIYHICGSGFTLLDSVINWAYDTLKKYDETHHKEVGTLLGFFQPHIDSIVRSIMKLTPYLPQKYLAEYQGEGLNLTTFAPPPEKANEYVTTPNVYYYFFIGKVPSQFGGTLATALISLYKTGEVKLEDIKPEELLGLSFLQLGFHTEKTLNRSLKLLKDIIKKVGATIQAAGATYTDLSPLNGMLDRMIPLNETQQPYIPTPDEFDKMTTAVKPLFAEIKKRLKPASIKELQEGAKNLQTLQRKHAREAAEREQIIQLLQETGARLLYAYIAHFEKQEAVSQQQKDAFRRLVALFTTAFGNFIDPGLNQYLQAIVQDMPLSAVQPPSSASTYAKASSSVKTTADKSADTKATAGRPTPQAPAPPSAPGEPATEKPVTKPKPKGKPKAKPQPESKPSAPTAKPQKGQPSALEAFPDIFGGIPGSKPQTAPKLPPALED